MKGEGFNIHYSMMKRLIIFAIHRIEVNNARKNSILGCFYTKVKIL